MKRPLVLAAGFVASLILVGGLILLVGVGRVGEALVRADPWWLAAVAGFALAQIAIWGQTLRTVLGTLGVAVTRRAGALLYAAAAFSNNVTPLGQAGGEPVTALVVSRTARVRYETSLAAVASVDALNVVTSLTLVAVGVGYYGVSISVRADAIGNDVLFVAIVALAVLSLLAWRFRGAMVRSVTRIIARFVTALGRVVPPVPTLDPDQVRERLDGFLADVERVAGDRSRLAAALAFSLAGWLAHVAALWAALSAVGYTVDPATLLVVVPVANAAGFTPLPGGFGSIEAAFVALLATMTAVPAADATAAVLVHRAGVYWLPIVVGGAVTGALGADTAASGAE
ncbi:flippase-like domain-containing protein [Halorarum halophilum]|uniref:Flippase-like domain-containing protein n=1 Tax=Halorarum halophilum TaxID=2743090 RepID=A0A7D5GX76_9EURY|nr:lysylphosphatidylglycerol synthase transmembrane domain-containing protein [Halobaculum halophilum]QLG26033.1 flippase-like domain-containing protein [Halobaculum halophilum]